MSVVTDLQAFKLMNVITARSIDLQPRVEPFRAQLDRGVYPPERSQTGAVLTHVVGERSLQGERVQAAPPCRSNAQQWLHVYVEYLTSHPMAPYKIAEHSTQVLRQSRHDGS